MSNSVILPYDPEWKALVWAKAFCPSYITNQAEAGGGIVYYFANERDKLLFALKWLNMQ